MTRERSKWNGTPRARSNGKHPGGRPPIYNSDKHPKAAYTVLSRYGLTDTDLASVFGVDYAALASWRDSYPEFGRALKKGRDDFISGKVVKALAARAKGYSHPEEKIFCNAQGEVTRVQTTKHYPPDTVAIIYFLNNWSRRWANNEWTHVNRLEHTGKDGSPIQTEDASMAEVLKKLLKRTDPEVLKEFRSNLESMACANTDPC